GREFCRYASSHHAFSDDHSATNALDMFAYGVEIERVEGAQVDDCGFDPLLRKVFGGLQRIMDLAGISDDDDILASPANGSLAPCQRLGVEIDVGLHRIERLVLYKDYRIGLGQTLTQQMIGVLNRCRHGEAQAWRVH